MGLSQGDVCLIESQLKRVNKGRDQLQVSFLARCLSYRGVHYERVDCILKYDIDMHDENYDYSDTMALGNAVTIINQPKGSQECKAITYAHMHISS